MAKKSKPEVTIIKNTERSLLTLAIHAALSVDPRAVVRQYIIATRA